AAGTPCYMAPEQFDDVKSVDVKADIYSFGVMLFQMITGKLPFSGRSLAEYRHCHKRLTPPHLSRISGSETAWQFSELVDRCLAKSPSQRFEDFREVRVALARAAWDPCETYLPTPPPLCVARPLSEDELLSQALSYRELGRHDLASAVISQLIDT